MRSWTKTAGFLFLATASVYSTSAIAAAAEGSALGAGGANTADVKLLADAADPFAAPATQPATQPAPQSLSGSAVNVSPAGTVEIHVNDASLVEVLRMLSLQSQRNIIASKEVTGTVTANLYDVTVKEALDAVLHANGYGYKEKGNFIYVYTAKQLADMERAERKANTETFRLYYTPAGNAVTMIKPVLSSEAQVAFTTPASNGITSGGTDVGGNSHAVEDILVITDYPENLDRARKVLREVDRRPQQILVEATLVRASLTEDNALGIDFTVLGGVDFSSLSTVGTGPTGTSGLNQALTGTIIENSDAGRINDKGLVAARAGGSGLNVGIIKNNVGLFLTALEGVTDTTVLANPKLLVLNKQKGEVHVGREDGYEGSTTATETASVSTVQMLSTGIRLIFRPYIGDDGYIRMEVHPEDSNGSVNPDTKLPSKTTTEITTNIMVKDGHTIVIGGLFREAQSSGRSQVPVLGNMPLVGPLFRKQTDHTEREEVIILLTPHIVKDDSAYSAASELEAKQFEKLRVGLRRGMMFTGRERLAEASYEKAVAELNKPRPDRKKALWYLDEATNLNPKFAEAINLKQSLTNQELTSADNSSIRSFVKRQILAEKLRPTTAPAGVSAPATQPVRGLKAAAEATTQPVAAVPTTQPLAGAATTQPVAEVPSTQPVADATTQPAEDASSVWSLLGVRGEAAAEEECDAEDPCLTVAPSTQPAITVLPLEDDIQADK